MTASRLAACLVAACSAALLAPLLGPLVADTVFVKDDLAFYHLPMRYLFQRALQAGDSVLWTPSIFSGLYLHGEGQVGLFHPFHQLLYRVFPLRVALNLELVANYPMAFGGMCWLLRRLQCGKAAALFGAMLFTFSGFNLLHHVHINMVAVVAHMPWLLACADMLIVDERRHARTLAVAAIAIILASEILLGFPQAVLWNVMTLAAFALFRAGQAGRWRPLAPGVAAVALGGLLGGIQLLPTVAAAQSSTRAAVSDKFALSFSLHPYNLFQLWSPSFFARGVYGDQGAWMFHEFGIYSGAILPIALIWVWIRRRALPERRALITGATVFCALGLILALGRYGGVTALLAHLPVFESLRAPVRYILFAQFAMAILAAVMLDDLLAIAEGRSAPPPARVMAALWIPAVLGIGTTVFLNSGLLGYGRYTFSTAPAASMGVAIVMAVTLLVHVAGRRARWAIAAIVVVTALDLAWWGIRYVYDEPPIRISALTRAIPPAPDDPAESYAAAPEYGPYRGDVLILRGYRLTTGYVGLFPATGYPLGGDLVRRFSGTRWIFTPDGVRQPVDDGLPRVRLLDERRQPSGSARLVTDRPGLLVVEVDAPGPGTVALTERFHKGWSAEIDGAPVQTISVRKDFLGCAVEGGVHRVTFRFMPRSFVHGSIVSAIGAALLAGFLILRVWPAR